MVLYILILFSTFTPVYTIQVINIHVIPMNWNLKTIDFFSLIYSTCKHCKMWYWEILTGSNITVLNSRGARVKKSVIKGDNWSVKGPTKNLYIFIAEVVLMTVWSGHRHPVLF